MNALHRTLSLSCVTLVALSACAENQTPPPEKGPYKAPSAEPLSCVPNLDGKIEASELQAAFGVPVSYLVSPAGRERAVDLAGSPAEGGMLHWDLGADYADDRVAKLSAKALTGTWYESAFPGATFAAPFDAAGATWAIYAQSSETISLMGLASKDEAPADGKTLLVYQEPIAVYRFPLTPGMQWIASSKIENGTVRGLPYAGKDTYEIKVDGEGTLELPDLRFSRALRMKTRVTVQPAAGESVVTRQTSFFFECFGEVARATSRPGEQDENFKIAAELRRFGL